MITNEVVKIRYAGNGTTQTLSYPFRIYRYEDLVVISSSGGEDTVLQLDEHYYFLSLPDNPDGGLIELGSPIAIGQTITLLRRTPASQDIDLKNKQDFPAESTETQLDRMTMRLQELEEAITRCVRYRASEADLELPYLELPDYITRTNKLLSFDSNGHLKLVSLNLSTITVELDAVIPDGSVTAAKLSSVLDLSAKTITLPDASVTAGQLDLTQNLSGHTVILPEDCVADPQVRPYSLSRGSLNPTLRPLKMAVGFTTTRSIQVTGAVVSAANQTYSPAAPVNGYTRYVAGNGYYIQANVAGTKWILYDASDVEVYSSEHAPEDGVTYAIEDTPDQMPPWVVYGTSTPGPTVTVAGYTLEVNGTIKADRFEGSVDSGPTSEDLNQTDRVALFPTGGNISRQHGSGISGGNGGLLFMGVKGFPRYIGVNDATDKQFQYSTTTALLSPIFKRLFPGTLTGVTATCDHSGATIATLATGTVIKVVQANRNAYLLTATGLVYAVGRNTEGQLGQGGTTNSSGFLGVKIGAVAGKTVFITDIAATPIPNTTNGVTVAAVDIDGKVWTWGENGNGQCGDAVGTTRKETPYNNPAWAFDAATVVQVLVIGKTTYVLTSTGAVYGTGLNTNGQLGNGNQTQQTNFVLMTNTGGSIVVASMHGGGIDGNVSFLALTTGGDVYSCGYGTNGTLGNNSTTAINNTLTACHSSINGGLDVSRLVVLGQNVFAVLSNGSVINWGYNGSGVLGSGNTNTFSVANTPTALNTLLGVPTATDYIKTIALAGSGSSSVDAVHILTTDGKVFICGANTVGQLGADISGNIITTFEQLPLAFTPVQILGMHFGASDPVMYFWDELDQLWACGMSSTGAHGYALNSTQAVPAPVRI